MTALTVTESIAWNARKGRYWSTHPYRCHRCNKQGGFFHFGRHVCLEVHHLRYTVRGTEPDADLIGLCARCHDLIHRRHRRHSRQQGWMHGRTIVDRYAGNHYATLPRFTRRWVRIGRALAWRDGLWYGRLPELDQ